MKIKFCGITNIKDALAAVELNVDFIGFIININHSKRSINIKDFVTIQKELNNKNPNSITKNVIVLENPSEAELENYLKHHNMIDVIQLHGNESIDIIKKIKDTNQSIKIWKGFRVSGKSEVLDMAEIERYLAHVDQILLDKQIDQLEFDAYNTFLSLKSKNTNLILAGGINEYNISEFAGKLSPQTVDLSSRIEISPGIKDVIKMENFVKKVKSLVKNK